MNSFATIFLSAAVAMTTLPPAVADPLQSITIDGDFADWANVPSHTDPVGTEMHENVPDVHDTNKTFRGAIPSRRTHPDVDLLEYKFTHDETALYAYFRATGQIGRTQTEAEGRAGRYYVIVTIDVDDNDTTGYWINEGGYYPTSSGYDMNMEIEFFDGAFNTGHYLNHGAKTKTQFDRATQDQLDGVVRVLPGSYDHYTQWVWWNDLVSGEHPLPDDGASITFVEDRGPVYQGILRGALSADGHEIEMVAPFEGFMKDEDGQPIVGIGSTLDISFSLEASGELTPDGDWASDTGDPIVGYFLAPPPPPGFVRGDSDVSGDLDLSDALWVLNHLFDGSPTRLDCNAAADINGDNDIDVSDSVYLLRHLFGGGTAPPAPYPTCGGDPTIEPLGCEVFGPCS